MKTRLISIGNSKGVRLPKPLILEAGLTDEVELHVQDGTIVIARATSPRAGWAEAAEELRHRGEDHLIERLTPTNFDKKEWEW